MSARGSIEQTIDAYLQSEPPGEELSRSTPLISSGLLDSIAVLRFLSHLEDELGIEFHAWEIDPDRLDTPGDVAAVGRAKLDGK